MVDHLIGVISDTHGLLRPEAVESLAGVGMILHAGDVGDPRVLEELRAIAPVIAVRGNIDKGEWADKLPVYEAIEIGAIYVYMLHDVKEIDLTPAAAGFRVVISGHTHQPSVQTIKGVLYLNPGSAGGKRFNLPVSIAHLRVSGDNVDARIIKLTV